MPALLLSSIPPSSPSGGGKACPVQPYLGSVLTTQASEVETWSMDDTGGQVQGDVKVKVGR